MSPLIVQSFIWIDAVFFYIFDQSIIVYGGSPGLVRMTFRSLPVRC